MSSLGKARKRLGGDIATAAVVSLIAHGIVLSLHFVPPTPEKTPAKDTGVEIILLNAGTQSAPTKATLRAQISSNGGGADAQGHARSPLPRSEQRRDGERLAALQRRQAELEAQQRELAAQLRQRQAAIAARPDAPAGVPTPSPADAQSHAEQLQRQFAEISQRIDDYNKHPRRHFFAPSTSEYRYAVYVEQWRRKVEKIGNLNYPPQARGKFYGSLRMTAYVRADGTLDRVEIDQPSQHALLNDAARRIVALSAPFPSFPENIARDTDVLAITRTWHFTNGTVTAAAE